MSAPPLEQTYAAAFPELATSWRAKDMADPRLVVLDEGLAAELGLDAQWLRSDAGVAWLTGHGAGVDGHALAYAGHQFGGYSPVLGDGRALLLGELVDPTGRRHDLHLKGSGPTPYARRGDGSAVLGPMLREHVVGASLHALGVPTTRALAVLTTGETVRRDGLQPGALLVRVASSHLRVGTMQYAAAHGGPELVARLVDATLARHHPDLDPGERPALTLLRAVGQAQARLVAQWMGLGFVHGVLNTDNVHLGGESIDFGPCAFLDAYDPRAVFSSIDTAGRYAYGNQPAITQWNLARLAEAMLPLLGPTDDAAVTAAHDELDAFVDRYNAAYAQVMADKIGLARDADVGRVLPGLLDLLQREHTDWTGFFAALALGDARDLFLDRDAFDAWHATLADLPRRAATAPAAHPTYIPRNHHLDAALRAAEAGDLGPYERLVRAVTRPSEVRADLADLAEPGGDGAFVTFCGT